MRDRRSLWTVLTAVIAMVLMVSAQEPKKEIKHVPIKATSPASGREMYMTYCAVCHGTDGKGNGPAAGALKVATPDLTALASKNGGKYPSSKVSAIVRGEEVLAAHGSKDMPMWGHLFRSISGGHEAEVHQRVVNLNKYIESLQKK